MAKTLSALCSLRRACSSIAAEKVQSQASIVKKVADSVKETQEVGKGVFWMRDPKTGNWIPENHFGEVDAADLRQKLLRNKPTL